MRKGATSRVKVVNRPKVSFWPEGSTSPTNYGWLFAFPYFLKIKGNLGDIVSAKRRQPLLCDG
jgi:hypothetical protein